MLEKRIISKFELHKMNRAQLIDHVNKLGLPLPIQFNNKDLIDLIADARPPEVSYEGIITIARMIKFEADLGRGTGGAYDFLRIVYPNQSDEETKQMARTIDKIKYEA